MPSAHPVATVVRCVCAQVHHRCRSTMLRNIGILKWTYADVCRRIPTYTDVCTYAQVLARTLIRLAGGLTATTLVYLPITFAGATILTPSRYARESSRILTYAHVCSRMLTYAHVCSRMLRLVSDVCQRRLRFADVCRRRPRTITC